MNDNEKIINDDDDDEDDDNDDDNDDDDDGKKQLKSYGYAKGCMVSRLFPYIIPLTSKKK